MKTSSASSARGGRAGKSAPGTKRRKIDFSDIPELSDEQLVRMRRIGRPPLGDQPRKLIAIRLDKQVLDWVKATAARKGLQYQSLINEILAREMKKAS